MNKLIWKGIDSSTIKGLLICELPPITKPKMRVQETVIDGVDGSIIEELGYESYDKSIKIGLTYDFNIDEVIKYFSGEGKIVFSNEPDKYYNAKIINRIDYERLLRFREATIKFRVQPFKYEYQEEEQVTATGTIEGTEIKIIDAKATKIKIDGRSVQETTKGNQLIDYANPTSRATYTTSTFENDVLTVSCSDGAWQRIYWNILSLLLNNAGKILSFDYEGRDFSNGKSAVAQLVIINNGTTSYHTMNTNNTYTIPEDVSGITNAQFEVFVNNSSTKGEYSISITKPLFHFGDEQLEYEKYTGGISSPNPDYPSEIESVGEYNEEIGKYEVEVQTNSKNLLNYVEKLKSYGFGLTNTLNEDGSITTTGIPTSDYASIITSYDITDILEDGETYIYSMGTPSKKVFIQIVMTNIHDGTKIYEDNNGTTYRSKKFTVDKSNYTYLLKIITSKIANWGTESLTITNTYQLEKGDSVTEFEKYHESNISVISLNEPLRSLPNGVKDIAYIKNNKLYVDRYVGSVVLDGSENWEVYTDGNNIFYAIISNMQIPANSDVNVFCNNYISTLSTNSIGTFIDRASNYNYAIGVHKTSTVIRIKDTRYTSVDDLKTWLSTHNTEVYYQLATPITEEYGDLTILELVDGENNISNSADTNMVIDYVDNKMIINNLGNYVSKPIFEIEGAGTIKFILNGYSVFSYNFDDNGRVVIDSEKEDAYLGTVLKNRNMNGEFPKLEIGENKITWDGLVKNIKAFKKSRWL